jgi:hypothetical protein
MLADHSDSCLCPPGNVPPPAQMIFVSVIGNNLTWSGMLQLIV